MQMPQQAALVTGGGRGLGRAIAERLAADGFAVGVMARTVEQVEAAVGAIRDRGGVAQAFAADVLDPERLDRALARFREAFGRLDALVCAAGQFRGIGPIAAVDPDRWWGDVETALKGTFQTIRAALPLLRASSAASITALVGPGHNGELKFGSAYGAAQAGLVRLVETLAEELRPKGIAVHALNPGLSPTPMMQHLLESAEGRRWLPRFTEAFAEGKEVGPEVAAEMASWLAHHRPMELSGRVVPALATPAILETRLDRIANEDLNRLRLR